jgi:putative heme-binding domain-containing protein
MIIRKVTLTVGAVALTAASAIVAQDRGRQNPREGDATAVRAGGALFRERCAECHGADAKGVAGHDLTRIWASGATDERVFQTIRVGVPNTLMPSSSAPDDEVWSLVTYLHSLNGAAPADTAGGNAENGERIFWSSCGSCHAVNGRGGRLGPDLSLINQSRDALTRAIRDPSASIVAGYQAVTLVTRDGQRIRGAMKSEDAFSIQILDTRGQLQGYLKPRLRDVIHETISLMPAFGSDKLSDGDLGDLLLFMNRLRVAGAGPGAGRGRGR